MKKSSPRFHSVRVALAGGLIGFGMVTAAWAQQGFKSPDQASEALVTALRASNAKTLTEILGPGSADLISSGDRIDDENTRKAFLLAYDVKHSVTTADDKRATLLIGRDDYPFSIPIVKRGDSWHFDAAGGREELLARRIGRNELSVVQVCLAYVDAQNEFAQTTKVGNLSVYAQRLVSTPGTRNGLYWPAGAGEAQSPMGEAVALATLGGYRVGSGEPYHGYYYKILTKQGPNAPGGAHDYVVNGKMIGGFALVAWPAQYGNSGIATFMVNHDGTVFEKDLGSKTSVLAPKISTFNPDASWKKVDADGQ